MRKKVESVLINNIIKGLTTPVEDTVKLVEPGHRDIVFRGTFEEVDEFFYSNLWTDGLPIVPPTLDKVERFLRFTDRSHDEVVDILLPENREATVWNVAVNGVMAGCRPEYMPILLAVVDAIADPEFRIEDAGSTPGWEPLIILNGPIIKELDFNCGSGVMRVGRRANTSIGRFLRLYMRNVPGLRIPPGGTDKGTFGYTFNVVLAENEDAVAEIGWEPFSVDQGFRPGDNVVTVQSVLSMSPPTNSAGHTALEHLETIAEAICRRSMAYRTGTAACHGMFYPLLAMSPSVASVMAKDGWKKDDIRRYLHDNVKERAGFLERLAWESGVTSFSFCKAVEQGLVSKVYCESTDPNRMVPVFLRPEWLGIVVSGDPGRNQSKGYVQNHKQGPPISKKIALPAKWKQLLQ
ncbi:MAG: hypothetical protein HYX92_22190 [Chloroflexi bacterium]|nr:hypothetical protein [Chloroflexota bacterium]